MSRHNRVSRVSAKVIGYLYFFDMYYFIWKVLDFNKLTSLYVIGDMSWNDFAGQ